MKRLQISEAFLSRFEASARLHNLHASYLKAKGITDPERPDWYSILVENGRDPLSLSAVIKGYPRGNRHAYSQLPIIKIGGRPYYSPDEVDKWFMRNFESRILIRAAA